ncbi:MAG: hypothetical protein AB2A00_21200 [Myxococcota bacterium]
MQPQVIPSAPARRHRLELAGFLTLVAFTYLTITAGLSAWNMWSRMSVVFSVVEHGTLTVDEIAKRNVTGDLAVYNGHHYSNKAPGPAFMAIPFYWLQYRITRALGWNPDSGMSRDTAEYISNAVASIIPTLFAIALLWRLLQRRYGLTPGWSFAVCGAWAFGSLAFPYSVMFFGHQTAAAFFTIGMCLSALELEDNPTRPRTSRLYLAGVAMGVAVSADFFIAVAVLLWTLWLMWRTRLSLRVLGIWALAGAGPAALLLLYNWACFDSIFIHPYSKKVLAPVLAAVPAWELPSLQRLVDLTVQPFRGILYATPVFALVLLGLENLRKERQVRSDLITAALGVVTYLAITSASPWAEGGYCIGPRYLTNALPFAVLLLVPAVRVAPGVFSALGLLSAVLMLAACLSNSLAADNIPDPFRKVVFPTLLGNGPGPMRNAFTFFFGWERLTAFFCYLGLWGAGAVWLWWRLHPARQALVMPEIPRVVLPLTSAEPVVASEAPVVAPPAQDGSPEPLPANAQDVTSTQV